MPPRQPRWPWYSIFLRLLRAMTRRASPALFAITMGTGAISNLFVAFPYGRGSQSFNTLSLVFFFFNLLLFVTFSALVIAKYVCYPDRWKSLLRNPITSLYTGCFPMGATTLISVAAQVIHDRYQFGGRSFVYFIWAVWWVDVIVSFMCCWIGVHVMVTQQTHALESMTAMWLLPVVTLIVAASSGGVLGQTLNQYSTPYALWTVTVSVYMVTVGLTLALMILTIYLMRLIIHGLPPGTSILSVFLPLGPTGQSGFAIMLIGDNLKVLLPRSPKITTSNFLTHEATGPIIDIVATSVAFLLWSLATMWILYALLAVYSTLRRSWITFRLSFWGLVFPNGVYANLTIQLADKFDSSAFRVYGAIYAVATLIIWTSIFLRSLLEIKYFFVKPSERQSPRIDELKQPEWRNPRQEVSPSRTSITQVA
ncbi:unnamed protein product [Cyclocybe aegerita]|uniref:C4-dicarboxylate transporter/malic acid transport protein n=1 Tax=Cyclocybe aegerita TaxID=1973307 RepID=A0A8S0X038_CYCAE|nr:unnamed protein product [Cyclocybe aegerita]